MSADTCRRARWVLASAALAACAPLAPGELPPEPLGVTQGSFPGLDPGAKTVSSLHFEVHAYGSEPAQKVSDLAEKLYNQVMGNTGLYSFSPRGLYQVSVYANQEEYLRKSGMPSWSGGVSVGNSIYSFDGGQLPQTLAHEMTHLIFHEYMGTDRPEQRWLNEGLAVYEEQEALRAMGRPVLGWSGAGGAGAMPFDRMISLAPLTEDQRSAVSWYLQASSVVRFMVERGGRVGMAQFLAALRDGRSADEAVRQGFPGIWTGMSSLESAWLRG